MPQKWTEIYPEPARFENFVYALKVVAQIVRCVDEKAGNNTIPGICSYTHQHVGFDLLG